MWAESDELTQSDEYNEMMNNISQRLGLSNNISEEVFSTISYLINLYCFEWINSFIQFIDQNLFSSNRRRVHHLPVRERLVHQRKISLVRPVYKGRYRMVSVQGWYVFLLSLRLWSANEKRCWVSTVEGSLQSFFVSVYNRIGYLGKGGERKVNEFA